MAEEIVRGAEKLLRVSNALKEAGNKDLKKYMRKRITDALTPLRKTILPRSARTVLPRRGGLGEDVARSRFTVSQRASSRTAGVRLIAKNQYSLATMDKGKVRHKVFGKNEWVVQEITPGWFSEPTLKEAPQLREAVEQALDDVIAQIERRI